MKTDQAEKIFQLIGDIDEQFIIEAQQVKPVAQMHNMKQKKRLKNISLLVASITFVLLSIYGISGIFNLSEREDDFAMEWESDMVEMPTEEAEVAGDTSEAEVDDTDRIGDDDMFYLNGEKPQPPVIYLQSIVAGVFHELELTPNIISWCYIDGSGEEICEMAEQQHILDDSLPRQIPSLEISDDLSALFVAIENVPLETITIRRWSVAHMGQWENKFDQFEVVAHSFGNLSITDIEKGWIYEIIVQFPQGIAHYVFQVE